MYIRALTLKLISMVRSHLADPSDPSDASDPSDPSASPPASHSEAAFLPSGQVGESSSCIH